MIGGTLVVIDDVDDAVDDAVDDVVISLADKEVNDNYANRN